MQLSHKGIEIRGISGIVCKVHFGIGVVVYMHPAAVSGNTTYIGICRVEFPNSFTQTFNF